MKKNCITLLAFTLCCLSKTTQASEQPQQHPPASCHITNQTNPEGQLVLCRDDIANTANNMLAALTEFRKQSMQERGVGARTQFGLPQSRANKEQNTTGEQNGLVEHDWFTRPPIGLLHTALILGGSALLCGIVELVRFYNNSTEIRES